MSWQVLMLVPVVNDGRPVAEGLRKGRTLLAQGFVRLDELYVGQKQTEEEAKKYAVKLAYDQVSKGEMDNSTVVGYVVRHRLDRRNKKERWMCTLQQVFMQLNVIRERRRKAA